MSKANTQLRGNCQVCGRLHAYTRGSVAAHGYTVKDGWFQGVCQGQRAKPLQLDRTLTDKICAQIRVDSTDMIARGLKVENGEIDPPPIKSMMRGEPPIPFAEAAPWQQREARKSLAYQLRHRGETGFRVAREMEALAERLHGTDLVAAPRDVAPPAVVIGERRKSERFAMTCTGVAGARVYWRTDGEAGKAFTGWTGSAAWRRYPLL